MDAPDEAAMQLDHFSDPLSIRLRLNDFPFSLQSLIQDVYCLPLAAQRGGDVLERGLPQPRGSGAGCGGHTRGSATAGRWAGSPDITQAVPAAGCGSRHRDGGRAAGGHGGAYTLPSMRAIHQLQGMMMRQMTLPPW